MHSGAQQDCDENSSHGPFLLLGKRYYDYQYPKPLPRDSRGPEMRSVVHRGGGECVRHFTLRAAGETPRAELP